MAKKKFDKQKLLATAVTIVLVFFFVGGFLIGLDRVQSMEGTFPPNELKESISEPPSDAEAALEYLDKVLVAAQESNPSLSYDNYFSIDSDTLVTDGSDTLKATLLFGVDNFEKHISEVEEDENTVSFVNFGDDITDILIKPDTENIMSRMLTEDFNCSYIYYSCPSCGKTSDELLPLCEDCGSQREYFKKYRDNYDIELTVKEVYAPGTSDEDISELKKRTSRTPEEISALTYGVFTDTLTVDNVTVINNGYKILYSVNRLTDEIVSLTYVKDLFVSADITFTGEYAELGKCNVSFNMTETDKFSFTWPSLTLSLEELVIEPKKSDNLLATLVCEDPLAMSVTWSSSDESIAVVDDEGYIDASKTPGEAEITATFEYLGKTYSDTCTVLVRVPVESMKMNKKSVTLSAGETVTLETKVSPAKATVQSVKWYTENEDIATVDADGVVTAVNKGEVIIYALSDDGYYRSTCEVTVE